MRESMDMSSTVCEEFGLTISTKKTKVMYQPNSAVPCTKPTITRGGQKLAVAYKFTFPGSTLSRTVTIIEEVTYKIVFASAAFGTLHTSVWKQRSINLQTKHSVYCAIIQPSLLYVCKDLDSLQLQG